MSDPQITAFKDEEQEHRPMTLEQIGWIFHVTCLCGEVFTGETVLFAWQRGADHAGVELR